MDTTFFGGKMPFCPWQIISWKTSILTKISLGSLKKKEVVCNLVTEQGHKLGSPVSQVIVLTTRLLVILRHENCQ